uniref:HAUS augmin-like complex subunit 8 n=1 Tax=Callorhinus ursinus TaxID=34884 RepID=A0A3Q7QGY1_CALUR|nr:HAUS augmin-like complex subunit 8 [Callorhinus ursinus]
MADSSGRGAGKPSTGGPGTPSGAKMKGKRTQGGRVVESRYLQYEKKTTKKPSAADALKTSGKMPEGGRKLQLLRKSKDSSGIGKGDLQSTLLEGHGTAPPDLDLSAINDKSMVRKTLQLEKTMSKKTESSSFSSSQRKSPDLSEAMEMMESQTLLLTLLTVKMENGLAPFEQKAERNLLIMCKEKEKLQKKAHELKRKHLLTQRKRELADVLDAQVSALRVPGGGAVCPAGQSEGVLTGGVPAAWVLVCDNSLQRELMTTCHLLEELGIGSLEENVKALDLLSELKETTQKKDLELRRSFAQVLELSAEASKEAALINQEVWEEAQGLEAPSRWYFSQEGACGEAPGEVGTPLLLGAGEPHAV